MYSWLCEGKKDWTVDASDRVKTQVGDVFSVQVDFGDTKEKIM